MIVAVAFAALVVGAGVTGAVTVAGQSFDGQMTSQSGDSQSITVSASGSAETTPDQVAVRVAVEATGEDAPAVRQQLADDAAAMRSALAEIGISDDQIQTRRYDLEQDRRRPRHDGEKPETQYRGIHSFTITVEDPARTGEVIDTTVANGANNIRNIRFTLSQGKQRELRQEALQDATSNARGQADTLGVLVSSASPVSIRSSRSTVGIAPGHT